MDSLLFFLLSIVLGYIWYKWPIWSIKGLEVVIWPCISAWGIWAVFTYRLFDDTITLEIYWTFFWTFFWSFWAIFGFAQWHHFKKKPQANNDLAIIKESIKRLEKLIPQKDLIWIGFKRIFQ